MGRTTDILIKSALQIKPSGGGTREMNATFRFAVKACLLAAVSGALFNQVVGLYAQDTGNAQSEGLAAPKIQRTASIQEPATSPPQTSAPQTSSPQAPSEVQKKLQELYRKNGQQMPSMNMEDLPNVQPQFVPPAAAAAVRQPGRTGQPGQQGPS